MSKRRCMGVMLAAMIVALASCLYFSNRNEVLLCVEGSQPWVSVRTFGSENRVRMWQDEEGRGWFFLPSCVRNRKIRLGDTREDSVTIDGLQYQEGGMLTWEESHSYQIQVTGPGREALTQEVIFMKSENIPAIFIDTESGGLDYLHEDKENEETGSICVVREDGNTEYQDDLPRISGRGNSTWEYEKKPYAIKLKEAQPLCEMGKSDRWRLLALWREGSRMDNRIAMDLAGELGLAYSPQGTWVDLYLNGEYRGIYLLTESVTVGKGRVDIYDLEKENKRYNPSIAQGTAERYDEETEKGYLLENGEEVDGGYLIEKDHPKHWEAEESGFRLSRGDLFTVSAPRHASREQVAYIRDYIEKIDGQVQKQDPSVWESLDLASFAGRFLVDEIALEMDTGSTSMYFYKDRGDGKLYSGPMWDYDGAFGEYGYDDGFYLNYGETIVNNNERLGIAINWYQKLYEMPELYQCIVEEYTRVLPFFERLLENGIDGYADRIRASVGMDDARWEGIRVPGDCSPRYSDFDANVKYTKFFIANRLNCLCARWNVAHEPFAAPADGTTHQVTFRVYEGVVEVQEIPDGEVIAAPPDYDPSVYQGWSYMRSGESISSYLPVYEDMELYCGKW